MKVLLVDDDALRGLLAVLLERDGHRIVEAEGVRHALAALETEDVDLIVSDLRMPGGSGLDLLALVRRRRPHLPFVLVTASPPEEFEARAAELGVAATLAKPFRLGDLRAALGRAGGASAACA